MKSVQVDLKKHTFFVQPGNPESNASLVDLLGSHRVAEDEQRDQKCRDAGPQNEYAVSADELVLVFNAAKRNSGLVFKYFVRFKTRDVLNPVQLVPSSDLRTRDSLVGLIGQMLMKLKKGQIVDVPLRRPKPVPGVLPLNCM